MICFLYSALFLNAIHADRARTIAVSDPNIAGIVLVFGINRFQCVKLAYSINTELHNPKVHSFAPFLYKPTMIKHILPLNEDY